MTAVFFLNSYSIALTEKVTMMLNYWLFVWGIAFVTERFSALLLRDLPSCNDTVRNCVFLKSEGITLFISIHIIVFSSF